MISSLRYYWESLHTSYWFLPALLGIAAIMLSWGAVWIDRSVSEEAPWTATWTYTGGPEGARAVLATIAGSMITVAGVVFSITIVALSLASAQFGPRLLRNFIRDRRNQFVLGTFTATFIYCLLVLRTVRGNDHEQFVPGISVTIGIVLAIVNLGVLIYFIHHVAISIQATQVIQSVGHELRNSIDRLWPDELGEDNPEDQVSAPDSFLLQEAAEISAEASGYVDAINTETLMELAGAHDLMIRLAHRPGHFVVKGSTVAWAWPAENMTKDLPSRISRTFILASQRTPFQDVEFAIDQLVEVAVRALSPGVNDPFTALTCLDRLGEGLSLLSRRKVPSPLRFDQNKQLRIVTYPADFRALTDSAFMQIRQYAAGSVAVLIRMLETIAVIADLGGREKDRAALAHHAELVMRAARRSVTEEADLEDLESRYKALHKVLTQPIRPQPVDPY